VRPSTAWALDRLLDLALAGCDELFARQRAAVAGPTTSGTSEGLGAVMPL
jgi:hypothetical protein